MGLDEVEEPGEAGSKHAGRAMPLLHRGGDRFQLAAIPAPFGTSRTATFEPASAYLTRETHGGSALPAVLAYTALAVIGITWCVAVIGVSEAMRRRLTATLTLPTALGGAGR